MPSRAPPSRPGSAAGFSTTRRCPPPAPARPTRGAPAGRPPPGRGPDRTAAGASELDPFDRLRVEGDHARDAEEPRHNRLPLQLEVDHHSLVAAGADRGAVDGSAGRTAPSRAGVARGRAQLIDEE